MMSISDVGSYGANLYALPLLFTCIALLILGLFAYYRDPESKVNKRFLLFSVVEATTYWPYMLGLMALDASVAAFWFSRIQFFAIAIANVLIFLFISTFIGTYEKRKNMIRGGVMFLIALYLVQVFTPFIEVRAEEYFFGYYPQMSGVLFPLFMAVSYFFAFMSFWETIRFYRREASGKDKKKTRLMIFALIIGYSSFVLEMLPNVGVRIFTYGFIPLLIYSFLMFYAIVKYNIMVIRPSRIAPLILSTMGDALITIDQSMRIDYVNEAALNLLHCNKELIVRKDIQFIMRKSGELFQKLEDREKITDFRTAYVTCDGEEVPCNVSATVITLHGERAGFIIVAKDMREINATITELEEKTRELNDAQEKLKKNVRELEEMNTFMVNRELEMSKMKKEIKELKTDPAESSAA